MKADLDLCYRQLFELCKGERKEAVMCIPHTEKDFDMQFSAAFDELKAYRDTGLSIEEAKKWKKNIDDFNQSLKEILNCEFTPDENDELETCEIHCGVCPHKICGKKQNGDILNSRNYAKLSVRNKGTSEEIAVITNDEVNTANSDIVVALTPNYEDGDEE